MFVPVDVKFAQMILEMITPKLSLRQMVEVIPSIQILNVVIVEFIVFRVRICPFT